jgi:hypothetical protein
VNVAYRLAPYTANKSVHTEGAEATDRPAIRGLSPASLDNQERLSHDGQERQADEVFLSSTAGGVIPVTTVDGEAVGNGKPGPLTRQLREAYWELHDDPRFSLPIHYD